MKTSSCEAAVAPVSDGLRISKSLPRNGGCGFVPPLLTGGESNAFTALGGKNRWVESKAGERNGAVAPFQFTASGSARRSFRSFSG